MTDKEIDSELTKEDFSLEVYTSAKVENLIIYTKDDKHYINEKVADQSFLGPAKTQTSETYNCSECDILFLRKSDLARHMKVHS